MIVVVQVIKTSVNEDDNHVDMNIDLAFFLIELPVGEICMCGIQQAMMFTIVLVMSTTF